MTLAELSDLALLIVLLLGLSVLALVAIRLYEKHKEEWDK